MVDKIRRSLPIATPDFDSIRDSLKEFMKSQDTLSEYNFDGSIMSVLLDVLAYNTHIDAFYLNQVGNESFLSTAVKRDSVVARASAIGYTPRSARSASTIVDVKITLVDNTPAFVDVSEGFAFNAKTTDESFVFQTLEQHRAIKQPDGSYTASLTIYEGKKLTHTFDVDAANKADGFVIPNNNVDVSLLRVYVSEPGNPTTFVEFFPTDDITTVGPDERVYYTEEVEGGKTKVYFGDDVLSKSVSLGGRVRVKYIVGNGTAANEIKQYAPTSTVTGQSSFVVLTALASKGGAAPESIESIKFNAPRIREFQNRAVTPDDYIPIVKSVFPNADDVKAVGGEKLNPPQLRKVVIYVKPVNGNFLSSREKSELVSLLTKFNTILTEPVIADPEYVFINVKSKVSYDALSTDLDEGQMAALIEAKSAQFSADSLEKFDREFRQSQYNSVLISADPSVVSADTTFVLEKRLVPAIGVTKEYQIDFDSKIEECSLSSSPFTYEGLQNCVIVDNCGTLEIQQVSGVVSSTIISGIGTINYDTGLINLNAINLQSIKEVDELFDPDLGDYYVRFLVDSKAELVNDSGKYILKIIDTEVETTKLLDYRG